MDCLVCVEDGKSQEGGKGDEFIPAFLPPLNPPWGGSC
jgi:hypothetical protein